MTECYEWLMCWLMDSTTKKIGFEINAGSDKFQARNDSQVYKARDLTKAYAEYSALGSFK